MITEFKAKTRKVLSTVVLVGISLLLCAETNAFVPFEAPSESSRSPQQASDTPLGKAYLHLTQVMDKYHTSFNVYTDSGSGGNHFVRLARVGSDVVINGSYTSVVHTGATAVKNTFSPSNSSSWGGFYFQNGILLDDDVTPRDNWGDYPDAGYDLRGATELTFWARGAKGGERVEFFAFGVGRNASSGAAIKSYPDSEAKVTLCGRLVSPCYITLENTWKSYTISLTSLNLSYIIGGFGWVTNAPQNSNKAITFYLDDIQYNKSHTGDLRLLESYETIRSSQDFDTVLRNVAFSYDNDLALIAFLAVGDWDRAKLLADSFVYAQQHDRYYDDDRLRNAYQSGDLVIAPGWKPNNRSGTVRMPGWWGESEQEWYEDEEFVGSGTGNLAWTMIALLDYYEERGGGEYLAAARSLGEWIETNTRDSRGAGGYTGGCIKWEPNLCPEKLLWKSTEHNIDLYVAFKRLYNISKDAKWQERADHAKGFVDAMWNETDGFYWTGTQDDGETINKSAVPLDVQAWALMAFGSNEQTKRAIAYVEAHHKASWGDYEGFDFNEDRDMPWFEGTGQMVVAYGILGETAKATFYTNELQDVQATAPRGNGKGIVAAPADGLTTGFDWIYYNRLHVGATAWFMLAEQRYNPYWRTDGLVSHTATFYSNATRDGMILESSETSSKGGTMDSTSTTFRLGDTSSDRQYRAILSFDTSSLPDNAVIQSAVLKIKQSGLPVGSNPFSVLGTLRADVRKGYYGSSSALQLTDFNAAATATKVGNFGATPASGWYSATLYAAGRNNVNKTGLTQFRLYFNRDDNDDNGSDYIKFYSGNYATSSSRPRLIIKYTIP